MKITYEEALKAIHEVKHTHIDELHDYLCNNTEDSFHLKLDIIDKFIEQHKPPTWEEVVKGWMSIGYEVSCNFFNDSEITSVMQKGDGQLKHISFTFDDCAVSFGQFVYSLTEDELNAINLTIQYLQGQHKENV